jgi:hypothetical protein
LPARAHESDVCGASGTVRGTGRLGAQSEVECRLGFEGRDQGWRGDEHKLDFTVTAKRTRCVVQGSCAVAP